MYNNLTCLSLSSSRRNHTSHRISLTSYPLQVNVTLLNSEHPGLLLIVLTICACVACVVICAGVVCAVKRRVRVDRDLSPEEASAARAKLHPDDVLSKTKDATNDYQVCELCALSPLSVYASEADRVHCKCVLCTHLQCTP